MYFELLLAFAASSSVFFAINCPPATACSSRAEPVNDTDDDQEGNRYYKPRRNMSLFDGWPPPYEDGEDPAKFWGKGGGPGGESATDDGSGKGWGFSAQPQTDRDGNTLPTDEYGNVVKTDRNGNRYPTDANGKLVITDRYGNVLATDANGKPVMTDEFGNVVITDKYGMPKEGFGDGWPDGWDYDKGFPFIGGIPPDHAYLPTGVSLNMPEYCLNHVDKGHCVHNMSRWGYNRWRNKCMQFDYTGCGGNENNFISEKECQRACLQGEDPNACDAEAGLDIEDIVS